MLVFFFAIVLDSTISNIKSQQQKVWRHISAFFGNKSNCSRWDTMKWPGLLREGTRHFITAKLVFDVGTVPICPRPREREGACTIPGPSTEFVSSCYTASYSSCLPFASFCIASAVTKSREMLNYFFSSYHYIVSAMYVRVWQKQIIRSSCPKHVEVAFSEGM